MLGQMVFVFEVTHDLDRLRSQQLRAIQVTGISLDLSLGESNAVFLRGVGGDAATEPHKTGCSGYPEEEFSGTHKTAFKNPGLPCGSKPVGAAKTLSDVQ